MYIISCLLNIHGFLVCLISLFFGTGINGSGQAGSDLCLQKAPSVNLTLTRPKPDFAWIIFSVQARLQIGSLFHWIPNLGPASKWFKILFPGPSPAHRPKTWAQAQFFLARSRASPAHWQHYFLNGNQPNNILALLVILVRPKFGNSVSQFLLLFPLSWII